MAVKIGYFPVLTLGYNVQGKRRTKTKAVTSFTAFALADL